MKAAVIGIAKDEGAYLADWIFHHLYFGFYSVHVCLNRTSDGSAQILDCIRTIEPNVSYEFVDWVDLCPVSVSRRIQHVAYASALYRARGQGVPWVMFLDIDEFWTPADFSTTVGVYLSEFCRMRAKGAICHLWHNELGGGKPFQPIGPKIEWKIARNVKTLFPVDAKLEGIRVHFPAFANDVPVYNADGEVMRFEPGTSRERVGSERFREAFVLHRAFRSEIEYMASLRRGRPGKNEVLLKDNRSGYIGQRGLESFKIIPEIHSMYIERRSEFYTKTGIKDLVEQEKRKVKSRGNLAKESIVQALNGNCGAEMNEIAKKVARGLQSIADIN